MPWSEPYAQKARQVKALKATELNKVDKPLKELLPTATSSSSRVAGPTEGLIMLCACSSKSGLDIER